MSSRWLAKLPYFVLGLIKLSLVAGLPMMALANASYDDALFIRLGSNIAAGNWLGRYDVLTLAKGPAYPIFLAIANRLYLPAPLAQQLLYVFFCAVMTLALKPAIPSRATRIFVFAVLLFNPVSFPVDQMARAIREGIYPAVTGLVMAFTLGLCLRWREPLRTVYVWAAALGISLGIYWLTCEGGIWIGPSLMWLVGWGIILLFRPYACDMAKRLVAVAVAGALAACLVCLDAAANHWEYDEFITVEFRDPAFLAAYGALARVQPAR